MLWQFERRCYMVSFEFSYVMWHEHLQCLCLIASCIPQMITNCLDRVFKQHFINDGIFFYVSPRIQNPLYAHSFGMLLHFADTAGTTVLLCLFVTCNWFCYKLWIFVLYINFPFSLPSKKTSKKDLPEWPRCMATEHADNNKAIDLS